MVDPPKNRSASSTRLNISTWHPNFPTHSPSMSRLAVHTSYHISFKPKVTMLICNNGNVGRKSSHKDYRTSKFLESAKKRRRHWVIAFFFCVLVLVSSPGHLTSRGCYCDSVHLDSFNNSSLKIYLTCFKKWWWINSDFVLSSDSDWKPIVQFFNHNAAFAHFFKSRKTSLTLG